MKYNEMLKVYKKKLIVVREINTIKKNKGGKVLTHPDE